MSSTDNDHIDQYIWLVDTTNSMSLMHIYIYIYTHTTLSSIYTRSEVSLQVSSIYIYANSGILYSTHLIL
jgi:hypothetical protein